MTTDALLAFARDSAWGLAGTLVAIIATVVAYRITPREKIKRLQFERSDDLLVGVEDNWDGRLQLLYEGKPRSNIWLVRYVFKNTGSEVVASSDFERPIKFTVAERSRGELLHSTVDARYPAQLILNITHLGQEAKLTPAMLNPGDRFAVTLMIAEDHKVSLDYRIAGLPMIEDASSVRQDETRGRLPWPLRWAIAAVMLGSSASLALWAFEIGKSLAGAR